MESPECPRASPKELTAEAWRPTRWPFAEDDHVNEQIRIGATRSLACTNRSALSVAGGGVFGVEPGLEGGGGHAGRQHDHWHVGRTVARGVVGLAVEAAGFHELAEAFLRAAEELSGLYLGEGEAEAAVRHQGGGEGDVDALDGGVPEDAALGRQLGDGAGAEMVGIVEVGGLVRHADEARAGLVGLLGRVIVGHSAPRGLTSRQFASIMPDSPVANRCREPGQWP